MRNVVRNGIPFRLHKGTPFSNYTIPGLVLGIVVGGSSLVGAATVFLQRELAVLCSVAAGLIFAGWITGEVLLLGPFALTWQIPFLVWGLVIFGLAFFLYTDIPFAAGTDLDDGRVAETIRGMRMAMAVNALGLPAVALPVDIGDGLPQAVQVMGLRYREDLCLDAAAALEERVGIITPIDPREP